MRHTASPLISLCHPSSPLITLHHPSFHLGPCPPAVPGHSASINTAIRRPPSSSLVRIRRRFPTPSAGPIRPSPPPPRPLKDPPCPSNCIPLRVLVGDGSLETLRRSGAPTLRHPWAVRSPQDAAFLSHAGPLRGGSGPSSHRPLFTVFWIRSRPLPFPFPSPSRALPVPLFFVGTLYRRLLRECRPVAAARPRGINVLPG